MKFKRKPEIVEATQWWKYGDHKEVDIYPHATDKGYIQASDGYWYVVTPGDWIVTDEHGCTKVMEPVDFTEAYERISNCAFCSEGLKEVQENIFDGDCCE